MNLELHTERTILAPLTATDIDLALELFTDPEATKFIGGVMSEKAIRQGLPTWIKRGANGCIGIWSISDRNGGEKYGDCYLLPLPIEQDDTDWDMVIPNIMPDGHIEIGYFLKQSSWGKGFATEVCRRLLQFVFEQTPLDEVIATVDADNHRSIRVLEKAGFVYRGRMKAYAEVGPFYSINRELWVESTAQ